MLSSRRDVDKQVDQLLARVASESERNLKALTVAKMYIQVSSNSTT